MVSVGGQQRLPRQRGQRQPHHHRQRLGHPHRGGKDYGVEISTADITTTGTGNVSITGTGGGNSSDAAGQDHGVFITGNASVKSTDATGNASLGTITITGYAGDTGGSGNINTGIYLGSGNISDTSTTGNGGSVTSVDGNISITGTSGSSVGYGTAFAIANGSSISTTGLASIVLQGTGGPGNDSFDSFSGNIAASGSGNISITGLIPGSIPNVDNLYLTRPASSPKAAPRPSPPISPVPLHPMMVAGSATSPSATAIRRAISSFRWTSSMPSWHKR